MKKIGIIPARSGSKGLPNKNILMLLDKPLIAYTIEEAIKSKKLDEIYVTTDSMEYKEISEKYGAKVILRDERISDDKATSFMVIEDLIRKVENFDYFVLLQPTSPFRTANNIIEAVDKFEKNYENFDYLVSVVESDKNSDLIKKIDKDESLKYFDLDYSNYRRQNSKEYTPNGAIFIGKKNEYLKQKHFFGAKSISYIMNKEDSIDIDDRIDFELAITIATNRKKKNILLENIKKRIKEKEINFLEKKDITLIGHSIFDYWNVKEIKGKEVNNLGIAGINTKEYLDFIFNEKKIKSIGDIVILFAGTNDIVIENWKKEDTLKWIIETINYIKDINKNTKIYLIEIPKVYLRVDKNNKKILELNEYLKRNLKDIIKIIELGKEFEDKFGNLKQEFTYDGLHFNEEGYKALTNAIEKEL